MSTYKVLGLMSGTSLDGLDIAYCHIWEEDEKVWQVAETNKRPAHLKKTR